MHKEIPQTIGRYRIIRQIGLGAMGEVYLAQDELIHRKVAIKSLRLDRFTNEENRRKAIESLLHEARIVGNLNHSHITAVYDIGEQDGATYIVMEYVEGKNIKELIDNDVAFPIEKKTQPHRHDGPRPGQVTGRTVPERRCVWRQPGTLSRLPGEEKIRGEIRGFL